MSFGYTVLGFGTVATAAGVSAPSSMIINDDDGTDDSISYQENPNGAGYGSAADVAHGGTITLSHVNSVIKILAYPTDTGDAATSWSWALSEVADSNNIGTIAAGTTGVENYIDATVTISGSTGQSAVYALILTGTNSGGSTASSTFAVTIAIPGR
jgi:hypothetical protein